MIHQDLKVRRQMRSIDTSGSVAVRAVASPKTSITLAHVLKMTAIHRILRERNELLPISQKKDSLMLEKRAVEGCEVRAPFMAPLANYKKLLSLRLRSPICMV